MSRPLKILLAEDHQVVREGLRALLLREPDFDIVGEAADGLEAVKLAQDLRPDILILDLMMPAINGVEVTRRVLAANAHIRVIILSMHADKAYILQALHSGASGYVLKDSSGDDLVQAARTVMSGDHYLSPSLSDVPYEIMASEVETGQLDPTATLTPREREVFHMVAEGLTSAQIARQLSISSRTVETHRARVLQKLGLSNVAELVRFAVVHGEVGREQ